MCTSISYYTDNSKLFGRNLDLEESFGEQVVVTPRNYDFKFKFKSNENYALIGMALVKNNYPLYFDAMNEYGLSMAGLNFPGNANYKHVDDNEDSLLCSVQITSYEFIPWVLRQCRTIEDVKSLLVGTIITDKAFDDILPPTPLHWMISDKENSIVIEQKHHGIHIYDNSIGVMTNNPPFDMQLFNLNNYMSLSSDPPQQTFGDVTLSEYSRGMGAMGLPGDLSSMSRFVRAAFVKMNSIPGNNINQDINQFFHILHSVEQQRGCVRLRDKDNAHELYEITQYTSCMDLDSKVYYYTTYDNHRINAVSMYADGVSGSELIRHNIDEYENIQGVNFIPPIVN